MKRSFGAALGVLVLCLAACNALGPKIEVPQVTLVRVAMTSADIFNQQFMVRMHVENPNDREASTTSCSWKATASPKASATSRSRCPRRARPSST